MLRSCILALLLVMPAAAFAQDSCRLCYSDRASGERQLTIEIFSDLAFSRLALAGSGGGSATLTPDGNKQADGGMIDLGGIAVSGHGRISGEPGREVRIDLPQQVTMSTADGSEAELVQFSTDLPDRPVLAADGTLEFRFGARLVIKGQTGGNFRGRIPISVDYN